MYIYAYIHKHTHICIYIHNERKWFTWLQTLKSPTACRLQAETREWSRAVWSESLRTSRAEGVNPSQGQERLNEPAKCVNEQEKWGILLPAPFSYWGLS